jgi:acyl carrier protein
MNDKKKIIDEIIKFVMLGNPSIQKKKIPLNQSLLKLSILDSYGIIELVTFVEKKYGISIGDEELTSEKFGSIEKISSLIIKKISKK